MEQQPPGMDASRRPIKARGNAVIQRIAAALARTPLTPNAISVLSIVFAAAGAAALWWIPPWGAWLCALGIQLRLLCNLFDGMVAVEGGKSTPAGALYNEVPDRVADSVLLVALGHAAGLPWAGWLAALFAAATAYVRTLGGALGQAQDFRGPMAKQHRMAVMTAACVLAPAEALATGTGYALPVAVLAIAAGALLTCYTRLRAIAARLEHAP
ncbi:CDP-alcohol phosphatidyltransferase family protein [Luteimonas wenzhouensis]|uniref:CDP-alcohol phosphatidyltransferase family protein n=1 Tax=Luteimonas wenzhouensis TaxID=2599615 RepID=A0A5C5TWU7_9GAMM|nr:CDP-alcohol phosphatidyltransferase family protein [Luteimonas wenzhouensis]TWT17735.1 CDP-alcohol phosphatidyltransferase family protein [Luteimonas wenzhouensis]